MTHEFLQSYWGEDSDITFGNIIDAAIAFRDMRGGEFLVSLLNELGSIVESDLLRKNERGILGYEILNKSEYAQTLSLEQINELILYFNYGDSALN